MKPALLSFPDCAALGSATARALGAEDLDLEVHHFPDGESLVTLPETLAGRDVAILASLHDPDRLALSLRFAAATARGLGALRVGLIAPYLAYMRQDHRFRPGQAVSAPLFAGFLQESFDWLVTVDPHLHRIGALSDIFTIPTRRVAAAPLVAEWIAGNLPDAVLLGPDSESAQWVAEVAGKIGRPFEVLEKQRHGDRNVEVSLPANSALLSGTPVILDDIVSSGRTVIRAIERLQSIGTKPPVVIAIHAVLSDTAYDDIRAAGAAAVVSSDTIPHASNRIGVAPLLAEAARELLQG